MTVFRFKEHPTSRSCSALEPKETRIYTAGPATNEAFIRVYAVGATPAWLAHELGTIYRQDIQIDPIGRWTWKITVPYAKKNREEGSFRLSFSTTGGTFRIKYSKATVASYARPGEPAPPDQGRAIGRNGDDIEGADVTIPAMRITATVEHPAGIITMAQAKNLYRWTGRVNSDTFLECEPGEILFMGWDGEEGTDTPTKSVYNFAYSENLLQEAIGDVIVAKKEGWDIAWIWWEDHVIDGKPATRPRWVYVEQLYERIAMAQALGFGG